MTLSGEGSLERALRGGGVAALKEPAAEAAARFARRAEDEGLVDVAYGTLESPVGTMLVAMTERGLVRVSLPRETFDDVVAQLASGVSPRVLELPKRVDAARRELDEYFAGRRREFDLPLDWRLVRGRFARKLLGSMTDVPWGQAITYSEAARRAGNARAARAAGNALGSNPLPIVVPCHRVVRAGGVIGGYGGGPELKEFLLRHEGWLE